MFKRVAPMSLMIFLVACPDNPYVPPINHTIQGYVEMGSPIVGARVAALKWKNLKRGEELASATTDANGKFQMIYSSQYGGPIVLVATAGELVEVSFGGKARVEEHEELLGAVSQPGPDTATNINAWTTFAVARAEGTRSQFGNDEVAVAKNFRVVGSHLRNENNPVAISTARTSFIFSDKMPSEGDDLVLALTHLGLSQLARDNAVTLPRLISVLKEDLLDGVWDGKSKNEQLFFDKNQTKPVNSYATRILLADSIDKFISINKMVTIDRNALAQEGNLFDSLCFDARELVYPSSEPVKAFTGTSRQGPTPEPTDETETHSDLASALIASSGDVDRALFWLVNQGKAKAIRLAKLRGANINAVNAEGNRPLCVATAENQEEVVKALIGEGAELNYNNRILNTPISIAGYKGFENLIRVLARAGGDVNFTGPKEGMSSLALAARFDQVGSILTLISLNANVNSLAGGTRAAHSAAAWGRVRALKTLLDNGANPHLKDSDGRTVFEIVEKNRSDAKYDELMRALAPYR